MKHIRFWLKPLIIIALCSVGLLAQKTAVAAKLTSETWYLVEINKQKPGKSGVFLKFNKADKSLTGDGGCNQIYGKFQIKGKNLKLRDIVTTKMFCSEDKVMLLESDFVRALDKVTRYVLTGNELRLFAGRKVVLRFSSEKPPVVEPGAENPELSGKKWVLTRIGYGDVPKTKEPAFIVFDKEKGTISGSTSCNLFNGKYQVNGEKVAFAEIISTKRACLEDNTMGVEMQFLEGLRKTEWFSIGNGRLTLSIGRYNLLTFEVRK